MDTAYLQGAIWSPLWRRKLGAAVVPVSGGNTVRANYAYR